LPGSAKNNKSWHYSRTAWWCTCRQRNNFQNCKKIYPIYLRRFI